MTENASKTDAEPLWEAIPPDPPPLPDHYLYGACTRSTAFGQFFVVAYYGTHSEQLTWNGERWRFKPFPAPRPIFGRELLLRRPADPVLVVDSPDMALLGRKLLPAYVVVSWAGGLLKLMENDWGPLKARSVLLWPNAGEYHAKLIALLTLTAGQLRIIDTRDLKPGADIADAMILRAPGETLAEWAGKRLTSPDAYRPDGPPPRAVELLDAAGWKALYAKGWEALGIDHKRDGTPYATLSNISRLLEMHAADIWYDDFSQRVRFVQNGVERHWEKSDSDALTVLMQREMGLSRFQRYSVHYGIEHAARLDMRHSLRDWLGLLEWDGTPRISDWLFDVFGVVKTPYTSAIARNWLVAMVARAFDPGCPFAQLLVLEGGNANDKTLALSKLANPWFVVYPGTSSGEEFYHTLKGRWLIELRPISRMTRGQMDVLTTFICAREDSFREGRPFVLVTRPRTTIFVCLTEDDVYVPNTICWGVKCGAVDLEALALMREQLFAEAVSVYRGGYDFSVAPARPAAPPPPVDSPMLSRPKLIDPWTRLVLDYADHEWNIHKTRKIANYVTTRRILKFALQIPLDSQGPKDFTRISKIMRANGWVSRRITFRFWRKLDRGSLADTLTAEEPPP